MVPATCHIFLEHFCLVFSDCYFNFASFKKNIFRIGWYLPISRAYKIILDTRSSHCEDEWCLTLVTMADFKVHALNCNFVLVLWLSTCDMESLSFITVGEVRTLKSFPGRH